VFPNDITLVNVFGTLFNAYFGTDIAAKPDAIYRWDDQFTHLIPISSSFAAQ